jgi:hypothetical protein
MPVRFLNCLSRLYDRFLSENEASRFGKKLITLPAPRCVVFCSGTEKDDERFT